MAVDWRSVGERLRNWGRWGPHDEVGTLNYITPERIALAASLAKSGKVFALGVAFDAYGPQGAHGFRRNPIHLMSLDGGDMELAQNLGDWGGASEVQIKNYVSGPMRFNDDYVMMPLQCATQWDALSHVYYDGQLYNGYAASTVTSLGASKDSIDKVAERGGVVGRGVLLDVARQKGVRHLAPNTIILPEDLEATATSQGVVVGEGDVVLVRTGWWLDFLETRDGERWLAGSPGLGWSCAEWLGDHKVAAVASDNMAVEASAVEIEGVFLPFHMLALRDMGMMLGEMWDLEALALDCSEDHIFEFLLVAQPLRFTGAVGSPVNPIAIK